MSIDYEPPDRDGIEWAVDGSLVGGRILNADGAWLTNSPVERDEQMKKLDALRDEIVKEARLALDEGSAVRLMRDGQCVSVMYPDGTSKPVDLWDYYL